MKYMGGVVTILLLFFLSSGAFSQEMVVLTEDVPPNSYKDVNGNAAGFSVEIVREMLRRAEIKAVNGKIGVYPWARAYMMLQKNKNHMLFSTVRTAKREKLFKWVGPIAPRKVWFFKLKKRNDIKADTLDDAKKYKIGAIKDFASTLYLEELGFNLDYSNREKHNFKKLIEGRFDMLTSLKLSAAYQMNLHGMSYNDIEAVILLDDRYDYYIAINRKTSDDIIVQLQTALDSIKEDGTYGKIEQSYLK